MDYHRTFQIGEREALQFYLYQALRRRLLGALGLGVVGLLVCWLYTREQLDSPASFAASMILSFVTVVAVLLVGYYFTIRGKVRAAVRRRGKDRYPQEILINGFGLRATANGREVKVPFDRLREIRETSKAFYLYMTEDDAWLLPKEQMEDAAEESARLRKIFTTVIESGRLHLQKTA